MIYLVNIRAQCFGIFILGPQLQNVGCAGRPEPPVRTPIAYVRRVLIAKRYVLTESVFNAHHASFRAC